jgi:hypothetical protein
MPDSVIVSGEAHSVFLTQIGWIETAARGGAKQATSNF